MDALMAALLAAALGQIGDRPARLAAILADRHARAGAVIVASLVALAVASGIAATLGALLAPRLTPEARALFVALALALQGAGMLFSAKAPERLERWRLGAFGTSLAGLFILAFGDGVQFVILALAARAGEPLFATIGATIGGTAAAAAPATPPRRVSRRRQAARPRRWWRRSSRTAARLRAPPARG
jgi:Ca2+/H+ antiporter, TMEM165/GDT1 family